MSLKLLNQLEWDFTIRLLGLASQLQVEWDFTICLGGLHNSPNLCVEWEFGDLFVFSVEVEELDTHQLINFDFESMLLQKLRI